MSTLGRDLWFQILRDDGRYKDDPIPLSMWTYMSRMSNQLSYKVCEDVGAEERFLDSPGVRGPILVWSDGELTGYGKQLQK